MTQTLRRAVTIGLVSTGLALALPALTLARSDEKTASMSQKERAALEKELRELEIKIEEMRLILPPAFDSGPLSMEDLFRGTARKMELTAFEVTPQAGSERVPPGPLDDGRPSPVEVYRCDLSGRGAYSRVAGFLSVLAHSESLTGFDDVRLKAEAGHTVTFSVRLAMAYWHAATRADEAPGQDNRVGTAGNQTEMTRALLLRNRTAYKALLGLRERFKPASLIEALAALDREVGHQAVALTEIRFAGEAVVSGVVLGVSAKVGLRPALEKAGFEAGGLQMSPAGDCQAFSLTSRWKATSPQARDDSVITAESKGLFDETTSTVCNPEAQAVGQVTARGTAAAAPGALTLRLREVDVADVFNVLHDVSAQNFFVDPDVKGRVSLNVDGATLDETLAAMGSAGLAVGSGPLRRVRRAGARPAADPRSPQTYDGQAISFSFKDGDLGDVLRLFEDISGLEILAPRELSGRVTMFVTDVPWDRVFEAVVSSFGMAYAIEKNRVFLGPAGKLKTPGHPGTVRAGELQSATPSDGRRRWWVVGKENLGAADLKLIGLARAGTAWRAYAYGPGPVGSLQPLEPGLQLFDARVSSVGPEGVTFQTAAQRSFTVPLRP